MLHVTQIETSKTLIVDNNVLLKACAKPRYKQLSKVMDMAEPFPGT